MPYKVITKFNSPNYTKAADCPAVFGYRRVIETGTNHHWGDPRNKPTFMGTVLHLCRIGGNTSAHSVVEAGRVAEVIDYAHAAWGNGSARGNATSLVVEMNPRASKGDWNTAAEYWADLWRFYGKFELLEHNDWTATLCPGRYDKERMTELAEKFYYKKVDKTQKQSNKKPVIIKPKAPKPAPKPQRPAKVKGLFWIVEKGDTLSSISEYYYGTPSRWRKIAKHNGLNKYERRNLRVGQRISIPGPLFWRVEVGDTLEDPAEYFGIPDWRTVQKNAGIKDPQTLRAGQIIRVY